MVVVGGGGQPGGTEVGDGVGDVVGAALVLVGGVGQVCVVVGGVLRGGGGRTVSSPSW